MLKGMELRRLLHHCGGDGVMINATAGGMPTVRLPTIIQLQVQRPMKSRLPPRSDREATQRLALAHELGDLMTSDKHIVYLSTMPLVFERVSPTS